MKNLTLKAIGLFLLLFSIINLAWSILPLAGMHLTSEQHSSIILPGIIIWIICSLIGISIYYILTKPIENKYRNLKEITDQELINISKKTLNINIFLSLVSGIMFFVAIFLLYLVFLPKFGKLSTNYIWAIGIPAIMIQPFFIYGFISLLFSNVNREFYAELHLRNLTSNGINVNLRKKILIVFGSIVIVMSLWIGVLGLYTGINQIIEEVKQNTFDKLNIIVQNSLQTQDKANLIEEIKKIVIADNEILILSDNSGNIISNYNKSKIFENKQTNITNIIKTKLIDKTSFYDNINQNIFSFKPINKQYILVLVSNIDNKIHRMNSFWIWFFIYMGIGVIVVTSAGISLSIWINKSTRHLQNLFEKLTKNDFSINATKDSEDEFGIISEKYNIFISQIRNLINTIQNTSVSVSSAGNQFSSISQQISQSANEQASTTEEVASSMEQMVATISSNTEKAEYTGKISSKSADETKKTNEILQKTIKSISEINNKITIISEIANKTDILSINAAIEAARAGEAGKGFAVVAQEIRKLADKTKIASLEINELSDKGQNISKIANEKLTKLIPEILSSAELVNNIVIASKEQQSNVENINNSIQQLTEITNENSTSAEEMSASAEELSAQAEQLNELISVFKIGNSQDKTRK